MTKICIYFHGQENDQIREEKVESGV